MNNFNKVGYSVPEVAQIFGCTPATIRSYIYKGYLAADKSFVNKRYSIRIRREHLIAYMTKNRNRFSNELLKKFNISDDSVVEKPMAAPSFAPGAYIASDPSELKGAWASEPQEIESTHVKYSPHGAASVSQPRNDIDKRYPSFDIQVDGRIMVAGCEKATVSKIIEALVSDRQLKIQTISINKR